MDLQILEHRVRVLSLARRGLWLYTHPLLKLLLLPRRSRYRAEGACLARVSGLESQGAPAWRGRGDHWALVCRGPAGSRSGEYGWGS
uniref:CASTOR1 N-terminal domain-containing protein n=1 Tax=Gopherus agassizii TaxID=38772 RepID=A0A452IBZ5_9SAUR